MIAEALLRLFAVAGIVAGFVFGGLAVWLGDSPNQGKYIGEAVFSFVAGLIFAVIAEEA